MREPRKTATKPPITGGANVGIRDQRGRFVAGGPPGPGRPAGSSSPGAVLSRPEFVRLLRSHAPELVRRLFEVAIRGRGTAAVRAAETLLNFGFGRPPAAVELTGPNGGPIDFRSDDGQARRVLSEIIASAEAGNDNRSAEN
jgi:hypothetical protein